MFKLNIKEQMGFTLIELMITLIVIAILAGVVIPSYRSYLLTAKLSEAFDTLSTYRLRMEQAYQDNGNYGAATCSVTSSTGKYFTYSCQLNNNGQGYIATATGKSAQGLSGYSYTINETGTKATTQFPGTNVYPSCWLTHLGSC